ncbi:hypothetical protein [Polyangium sp. 15x6]|uniref:hypothetical protein n=1 Tax=Polyangium sp. 15x6 TaxID=3042687 RepID=UPI00249ACBA8|nr:hypothetical protein [Polyangium sp. 15x6]MDI3289071.1 hypothetical protein [Polyangium sp. 15x6]
MIRLAKPRFVAPLLLAACSTPAVPSEQAPASASASAAVPASAPVSAPVSAPAPAPALASVPAPPAISADEAVTLLFPGEASAAAACADTDPRARIRCLLGKRYEGHASARATVLSLHEKTGSVVGVEEPYVMEGGFRGSIRIVPELPVGRHEKHLGWVADASADFDAFFDAVAARAKAGVHYRHRPIAWKFFRSVGRTTPSAYASGWSIGYNVSGSLHGSAEAVRETLFHEIFHLNDAARLSGPEQWSRKKLGSIHDAILQKCSTKASCLAPYAPMPTMVRGGTYYAFQPNNGDAVNEYGADLAARYYRETRAVLRGEKLTKPAFKCGPEENGRAWKILVDEFFGGVDIVPEC